MRGMKVSSELKSERLGGEGKRLTYVRVARSKALWDFRLDYKPFRSDSFSGKIDSLYFCIFIFIDINRSQCGVLTIRSLTHLTGFAGLSSWPSFSEEGCRLKRLRN